MVDLAYTSALGTSHQDCIAVQALLLSILSIQDTRKDTEGDNGSSILTVLYREGMR